MIIPKDSYRIVTLSHVLTSPRFGAIGDSVSFIKLECWFYNIQAFPCFQQHGSDFFIVTLDN